MANKFRAGELFGLTKEQIASAADIPAVVFKATRGGVKVGDDWLYAEVPPVKEGGTAGSTYGSIARILSDTPKATAVTPVEIAFTDANKAKTFGVLQGSTLENAWKYGRFKRDELTPETIAALEAEYARSNPYLSTVNSRLENSIKFAAEGGASLMEGLLSNADNILANQVTRPAGMALIERGVADGSKQLFGRGGLTMGAAGLALGGVGMAGIGALTAPTDPRSVPDNVRIQQALQAYG